MKINRVHISDIIDARRMDPIFFRYGTMQFGRYFRLEAISTCIVDIQSGVGAGKKDQADKNNGIIQIRPTNIDRNGMLIFDKNIYVPFDAAMPSLQKDDVLFNNTNSQELVGKTAIYKGDIPYKFSNHITRIRVNKEKIIPEFLWLILNMYQQREIFYAICTNWNNQSGVGTELLKSIKIPLPEMGIQQKIVDIYTAAQTAKLQKDKEAKELLESIDDYLLEALSINPSQEVSSESVFTKKISEMIGNRLDVSFYKDRFEMVSGIYPNKRLSSIVDIDPTIRFTGLADDTPISFIPMECIDDTFGEVKVQRETTIAKTKGYTKFEENDLLWAKITPCMQNGKSAITRNLTNGVGCGSTEYYVIRPKTDDLIIDYVYLVLRHHAVLKAAQNSFGGSAGQQRVSSQYVKSIVIPHPPIDVQKSIIATVIQKKERAKQLQSEGSKVLEEAKATIEKMILG